MRIHPRAFCIVSFAILAQSGGVRVSWCLYCFWGGWDELSLGVCLCLFVFLGVCCWGSGGGVPGVGGRALSVRSFLCVFFCVGLVERERERENWLCGFGFGEDKRGNPEWRLARDQQE